MSSTERFNLRAAIDGGRLALFYQPRMGVGACRAVGAEALLRWSPHGADWRGVADLGDMSADEFDVLWTWQLRQIATTFDELRHLGWAPTADEPGFFIALNVSHKQLTSNRWAHQLIEMLVAAGLPGCCLEVELTEQGQIQDYSIAGSAFEELRAVGVTIALDDFPEGGDSFARLARLRFDKVKLDRCMLPDPDDTVSVWMNKRRIMKDLLAMIEHSGASAVIEGVEREAQHRFLAPLNVVEWQGFLWGMAVPMQELARRLDFARTPPRRREPVLAAHS